MSEFKTEFGDIISFVDGFRAAHKRAWSFNINAKRDDELTQIGFAEFYGNAIDYGIVADFLTRHGLLSKAYNNSLDIGGSVGIFSRLLRANGNVRKATVIDIKDGSKRFSWSRYLFFWMKYKIEVLLSYILPTRVGVLRKNNNKFGYGMNLRSSTWKMPLFRLPLLDRYIASDFITFKDFEKYDFVVSVNAIAFFDYEVLFRRLREMTADDATVCLFTDNWWYPVNATTIYGDFPYAAQRLTKNDLIRYFREYYPAEADGMVKAYDFYHAGKHPVIGDYIKAARENGFKFIGSERLTPKSWSRDNRSTFLPADLPLDEVLRDIHKFKSDVTLEDLHASHVLMAFKRA